MRWRSLAPLPPLVALELGVAALLGRGQGWHHTTGGLLLAAALLALEVTLVYAVASALGGTPAAVAAALVLVLAPVVLARWYFVVGGPGVDYKPVYRRDVLPAELGLRDRSALLAACLLLASARLSLRRTWPAAAGAGLLAAAAALAHPHAWLALAAPVAAALAARRPASVLAALAAAGAGLAALALLRTVPHVPLGWHRMGLTLGQLREYTWSRRILEYLPLAGLVGVARRSAPAAASLGAMLVALVVLPLVRPPDVAGAAQLTSYLLAMLPGLPVYLVLAASIGFLVPRHRPARAAAPA